MYSCCALGSRAAPAASSCGGDGVVESTAPPNAADLAALLVAASARSEPVDGGATGGGISMVSFTHTSLRDLPQPVVTSRWGEVAYVSWPHRAAVPPNEHVPLLGDAATCVWYGAGGGPGDGSAAPCPPAHGVFLLEAQRTAVHAVHREEFDGFLDVSPVGGAAGGSVGIVLRPSQQWQCTFQHANEAEHDPARGVPRGVSALGPGLGGGGAPPADGLLVRQVAQWISARLQSDAAARPERGPPSVAHDDIATRFPFLALFAEEDQCRITREALRLLTPPDRDDGRRDPGLVLRDGHVISLTTCPTAVPCRASRDDRSTARDVERVIADVLYKTSRRPWEVACAVRRILHAWLKHSTVSQSEFIRLAVIKFLALLCPSGFLSCRAMKWTTQAPVYGAMRLLQFLAPAPTALDSTGAARRRSERIFTAALDAHKDSRKRRRNSAIALFHACDGAPRASAWSSASSLAATLREDLRLGGSDGAAAAGGGGGPEDGGAPLLASSFFASSVHAADPEPPLGTADAAARDVPPGDGSAPVAAGAVLAIPRLRTGPLPYEQPALRGDVPPTARRQPPMPAGTCPACAELRVPRRHLGVACPLFWLRALVGGDGRVTVTLPCFRDGRVSSPGGGGDAEGVAGAEAEAVLQLLISGSRSGAAEATAPSAALPDVQRRVLEALERCEDKLASRDEDTLRHLLALCRTPKELRATVDRFFRGDGRPVAVLDAVRSALP